MLEFFGAIGFLVVVAVSTGGPILFLFWCVWVHDGIKRLPRKVDTVDFEFSLRLLKDRIKALEDGKADKIVEG